MDGRAEVITVRMRKEIRKQATPLRLVLFAYWLVAVICDPVRVLVGTVGVVLAAFLVLKGAERFLVRWGTKCWGYPILGGPAREYGWKEPVHGSNLVVIELGWRRRERTFHVWDPEQGKFVRMWGRTHLWRGEWEIEEHEPGPVPSWWSQ